MEIKKAAPEDLSEIIDVLRASLGEADLPISEEIWKYKHFDNPFGRSIILVAKENGRIAGVRAFMRWKWQIGDKSFSAFRAVDTATHPDFQGRGIFKKLTLRAVEMGEEEGDNFIFNTPNEKSRNGYFKMGWIPLGRILVGIKPSFTSFWKISQREKPYENRMKASNSEIDILCNFWNDKFTKKGLLFTPKQRIFLQWRYEKNLLQQYEVVSKPYFYLAVYVKKIGKIKELRTAEFLYLDEMGAREGKKELIKLAKKFGVQVISYAPVNNFKDLIKIEGGYGPILTLRNLNLSSKEEAEIKNICNWSYSLGDLELF